MEETLSKSVPRITASNSSSIHSLELASRSEKTNYLEEESHKNGSLHFDIETHRSVFSESIERGKFSQIYITNHLGRLLGNIGPSGDSGAGCGGVGGDINNPLVDNYAGPKLFVKPSQKSNKTIIMNAIKDCCLAGSVNQDTKNKVLEEILRSDSKHFVILFRDGGQQYRALYTYNPDKEEVFKIHGVGPKQLNDKIMEKFLKYNSGTKTFSEVTSTKHLSATIDAVILLNALWQKKPAATQGKKLY